MILVNIINFYKPNSIYTIENDLITSWIPESEKPSEQKIEEWKISYPHDIARQNCKSQAQILLNESDWTDLYSVRQKLENVTEWDSYRDIIRDLRINPIENPIFPDKPKTIWQEIIPIPIEEPIEEIVVPINESEEPIVTQEEPIEQTIEEEIVTQEEPIVNNEETIL